MHEGGSPKASLEGQRFADPSARARGHEQFDKRRESRSKPTGVSVPQE